MHFIWLTMLHTNVNWYTNKYFLLSFAANFLLFAFFSFLAQKMLKNHISTSVWSAQHPNTGRNIQYSGSICSGKRRVPTPCLLSPIYNAVRLKKMLWNVLFHLTLNAFNPLNIQPFCTIHQKWSFVHLVWQAVFFILFI